MNVKKLLCMVLAMLLTLSALALAEDGDLQAQLDAANARIAELEAEVELYRPYYERQIVAEYGDGGIIWLDDAMEEYEAAASAYTSTACPSTTMPSTSSRASWRTWFSRRSWTRRPPNWA